MTPEEHIEQAERLVKMAGNADAVRHPTWIQAVAAEALVHTQIAIAQIALKSS